MTIRNQQQQHEGEWENVVSEDEVSQNGTLIVEGEEEVASAELDATNFDLSEVDFEAIASKMIVPPNDASYDNDVQVIEESFLSFGSNMTKRQRKNILVGVAIAVCLMFFVAGVNAWNRHWQYVAKIEQENANLKREREENKNRNSFGEQEEEWRLADNCYLNARLGRCAQKHIEDLNEAATSAWDGIGSIWTAATSWPFDDGSSGDETDEQQSESKMSSIHNMVSGVTHAFAHTVTSVANDVTKTTRDMTHGVVQGVTNFVDEVNANVDEALERILEATRDSVEDGSVYTRLRM